MSLMARNVLHLRCEPAGIVELAHDAAAVPRCAPPPGPLGSCTSFDPELPTLVQPAEENARPSNCKPAMKEENTSSKKGKEYLVLNSLSQRTARCPQRAFPPSIAGSAYACVRSKYRKLRARGLADAG